MAMEFDHYNSPLSPVMSALEVFKLFGGFPLKVLDQDGIAFHFHFIRGYGLSLALPLTLVIIVNYGIRDMRTNMFMTHPENSTLDIEARDTKMMGLSSTELITGVLQFLPNVLGMIIVILLFKSYHKKLSHLCHAMKGFKTDQFTSDQYNRLASKNIKIIIRLYSLILLSGIGLCIYFLFIKAHYKIAWDVFAIFIMLVFFQIFLVYFPIAMAASYLICQQILGSIQILLHRQNLELIQLIQEQRMISKFRSPRREEMMSESVSNLLEVGGAQEMVQVLDSVQSISHLETELISKGFHLLQLLEMADDVLGPFITVECVISLMSQVFGAFFSTNLMMALHGEGTFEPVKFTFGVACTFGALQWFFRLLLIFESGQRIVEEMVQTKKHLELIHINGCDVRDNFAQQRLKVLTKRYGNFYPIRPCGSFTLCRSSAVSAGGVLLTYIIVLLEFRLSESDQMPLSYTFANITGIDG